MSVDYDVRRDVEAVKEEQEQLVRTLVAVPAPRPTDETELLSDLELPGADLSDEILSVAVLPQQADEFRCTRCYLVLHQRLRVEDDVCRDCA
ncbi:MAG: DUF4193 family protein [Actinobacteria bacterium]|jgi:hypothetical protein|nr:DUF4193 family protein [Actinomycetota bacterium]